MGYEWLFYVLLFAVALLYASVGHGGASGYLALMAIFGMAPEQMKPTALLLNLFVSLTAFIQYYRGGHFNWKIFWPLALASIPMAYLGGRFALHDDVYKKLLGLLLLLPVIRFWFFQKTEPTSFKPSNTALSLLIGAVIGLLSGLIGIGGGIILSPILLLLGWTSQKQTAAISALFILVNSMAGLAGQLSHGIQWSNEMAVLVAVPFAGGLAGAWLGALRFRQEMVRNVLALVLLVAAVKLIFT
ncbi:sulfite exporter TauE/SafE family protein [Flavihumibacter petaseus]|uniref:Probable membrane transporter protein n=1 Tax=Flavihumibacter petaseus NBRC 106054 TaxID=1220578 RepID=A0A0E9N440_9BACT|nr:sulfite exporter TauE/SafE family protein [Flavihumibacter petaseus]GAO44421.1 hypothetical protein FPE01S_03_04590 [Flavihumibacter petaseus NBRC 106054]